MGDTAGRVVDFGSSELFEADSLVEDCFDHIGTGDEHVAGLVHHEREVGHCRRVHGSASTGTHYRRDLRNHARGENVSKEYFRIASAAHNPLLYPSTSRVVQSDDWDPGLTGHVHDR